MDHATDMNGHDKGNVQMKRDPKKSKRDGWSSVWRMLRKDVFGLVGAAILVLLVLVTLLAQWLSPYSPTENNYSAIEQPPSLAHPFGTDDLGRDILSRVMWGARDTFRAAAIAVLITHVGGILVGLISGFYGGILDSIIQRIFEVFLAFPPILLTLAVVQVVGPSLNSAMLAIGFAYIPSTTRLVRASVLLAASMEYITAAKVAGAGNFRIMFRHILPNILAPIIVYATLELGNAIMLTAGLGFLGLGAQPPAPEWGAMLSYGRNFLRFAPWMVMFPGLAIFVSIISVNLLGDSLRDALDPKMRQR
jgi:peptide/nickel transport system permease protein